MNSFRCRFSLWPLVLAFALSLVVPNVAVSAPARRGAARSWGKSSVTIEVARNQYDFTQPWSRRTRRLRKIGIVVGDHQILTSADQLYDRTLIRLQKNGRGQWWLGELEWVDYHANLAVITAAEPAFWEGLKPVTFSSTPVPDRPLQVLRWRDGTFETRSAEFLRYTVREGVLSPVSHVMLETSSDIQNAGWGEPVVADSKVLGILMAQEGRTCVATPASFIKEVLQEHKRGQYRGLGFFHFYWSPAENPASLASLKLPGTPRGVIVNYVPERPDGGEQVIKSRDVLLSIDGFALDIQGDYEDPDYGLLMLENLATRGKWAGDNIRIKLWREGNELDVNYRLPKFEYENALVPQACYDHEPEYLIVGGLVFQPLTESFLQSWGPEWKRRAPFRLAYYCQQPPTKEQPALVFLSQVLPDAYNIGYQELRYLVVERVNGQPVSRLREVVDALSKPINGFHVIEFMRSDSLHRLVLEAGPAERQATSLVLQRYGISEPASLSR